MVDDVSEGTLDLVYHIAVSPHFAADGVCFAARQSGLCRSEDGGITWQPAYGALNLESALVTTAVAISPDFASDHSVFAGAKGGVLRSVDSGKNWNAALFTTPPPVVSALVLSPNLAQDGVLLASTMEDGIFRSSDRGGHWSAWNFGLLDLSVLSLAISPGFADDETLFAGTETGIFRSTNGGRAWREVSFPTEFAPVLSLALSPGYVNDGILFAGTESAGLFSSSDRGNSWTRIGESAITEAVNEIVLSPEFPAKPDILAMLGDGLLVSRDGGQSWSAWLEDLHIEQQMVSLAAPQGLDRGAPLLLGLTNGILRI
jgi:photosystem II stability/assembly factor-like uncharacterized protein